MHIVPIAKEVDVMLAPLPLSSISLSTPAPVTAVANLAKPGESVESHQYATVVVAQIDSDVLGDMSGAFKNFIDSGQVWALLIGIVLGYVVRGITTYR